MSADVYASRLPTRRAVLLLRTALRTHYIDVAHFLIPPPCWIIPLLVATSFAWHAACVHESQNG